MSDLDPYVHVPVCREALVNEDVFNTFKSNSSFTTILEHTNEGYSFIFLERIKNEFPDLFNKIDWDKISENDLIGSPHLVNYPDIPTENKMFSPSTIAYTFKALDILRHMDSLKIKEVKVLEIGAGYGGQCKILFDLAGLFKIKIKSYTMVDLYYPSKLQEKYLTSLRYVDNVYYQQFEHLKDSSQILNSFNYLISIYALSEFDKNTREFYTSILGNNYDYYLLWNTSDPYDKFKNSVVEDEYPRTGPVNVLIKSEGPL